MSRCSKYGRSVFWLLAFVGSWGILGGGCNQKNVGILPNVTLSVTALNFGQIRLGAFQVQTVTLKNLTDQDIVVARVTSTNAGFRVGGYLAAQNELIPLITPFTIEKNAARTLYIGFYPAAVQQYIGLLVIESFQATGDQTQVETVTVDLKGIGIPKQGADPTITTH